MKIFLLAAFFAVNFVAIAQSQPNPPVKLPAKEKVKIYLLMGQSNMAGRGVPEDVDRTAHPRVVMFNQSNEWEVAVEPITRGEPKKIPGVGPGLAFGKIMADANTNVVIALVPCAVGGTPLRRWEPGADLYSNAVARAKAAEEFGTIAGVLWHQGEGDAGAQTNAATYADRFARMVASLRTELKSPHLPVVVGQIGEFNYEREGNPLPFARQLNETLANISKRVPLSACVLSKGLGHKGDVLHFSSEAQRELGKRYAEQMIKLQNSPKLKRAQSDRKLLK